MNLLSQIYNDGSYKFYLEGEPPFSVAVISGRRLCISEGLSRASQQSSLFHIKYFPDLKSLPRKGDTTPLTSPGGIGLLKSNWCMSQLHSRFSCVIFSLDWDSLRDVSLDVIKALDVWNSLLEYSRSVRSKVIVALATEEEETSVADFQEKQTSLLQVLKALLGEEFNALVPLFKLGMEKKSADILLQMLERLSREYHTSELTRLKNKTKKSREHELRCMFKAGRHCLVVRDLKTATECLEDAYDCLRSIVSSRAPMELRMCGTIIVIHILNAAKAEYSVATGDKYYNICENYMTLLEEPLSECESNTLAQFLRLLLIDELHFWLAKNTSCMTRSICASHLCASMAALEGALRLSRPIEKSEERLAAPPMIGVECCLDSHQCIYFLKETAVFLSERARGLLSDAASLTNPSAEVLYASMRLNVMLGRADAALQLLGKLWEQGVKSYDCTKSVHGLLMELTDSAAGDVVQKCSREVAFAFASLCFGPGSSEQQNSFRDLFVSAASRYPSDLLLSYPHKGYYAPFTVLCVFTHVHDNSSSHKMELTFCTHSIDTIALDSISVGLSRLCKGKVDGWGLQSSMNGPVELCSRNANTVSFLFCLEDPGVYFCSAVSARVRIGAICLNVEWRFDETSIERHLSQMLQFQNCRYDPRRYLPFVCLDNLANHIELSVPNHMEGVEGESLTLDVVIRAESRLNGEGIIAFSCIEGVYESAGCAIDNSCLQEEGNPAKGYVYFALDNVLHVLSEGGLRLKMKYNCKKAGKYSVSVTFRLYSVMHMDVEITKTVQVHICYPFVLTYTLFKTLPWRIQQKCSNRNATDFLHIVPEVSTALIQREIHTLVRPQEYVNHDANALREVKDILLYNVFTNKEKRDDINFFQGEVVVVTMSMECQCIQGVTLHSLEPIISTGTELVSVTAGPLPCHIEYMEVFTVTTKLRVLKTGRLLLGFVQMLLSPGSSTQRIASGFSLPEIEVESSTLELTVKYPPTATVGSHFTMTCEIVNKTAALQSCQFTMEKSNAVGLISGAENWNVSIGPHAACETSIVLRPLTTGVLHLPSVSLKHSSGGSFGSVAACQFHSQKMCVLPL